MGLARLWPLALVAAGIFVVRAQPLIPVGPDPGVIIRHDQVAEALEPGPLWLDRVWWDGPVKLDPSGVALSGWLAGRRDFILGPDVPVIVLQSGSRPGPATTQRGSGWSVLRFNNINAARSWLDLQDQLPHQQGGAYDWATISKPDTRLEDARW